MARRDTLRKAMEMIERYLDENADPATPVVDYRGPVELQRRLELSLGRTGVDLEQLLPILESYLRHGVRTAHPQFFNQLYAGFDPAGFLGDTFTSVANTSMYTYEVAPVATLMELQLIDRMNALIGFEGGEGILCTGASNANMLGMLCARDRAFPESGTRGMARDPSPVVFISDQSHYSFRTAASMLGIGRDNVVAVRSDDRGRMRGPELAAEIRNAVGRGGRPFFVGATAGTTVLGAFDPLAEIAEVCREQGLWMHIDGAWGGPVLLSDEHRHLLEGADLADSFAWDAHKLMGATLTCTAFLTRHAGALSSACGTGAGHTEYLFHPSYDAGYDLGKRSAQCGRRVDSLRLWLMWKHHGDRGFAERIDRLFALARVADEQVRRHPDLELMAPTQSLNICFRHLPASGGDLNAHNLSLRERLRREGRSFVNYAHLGHDLVLRLVLANPELTEADLGRFFDNVREIGNRLSEAGDRRGAHSQA